MNVYVYSDVPLLSGTDFLRLPADERWRSAEPRPWSGEWERPHTERQKISRECERGVEENIQNV